jgi:putative two-component system response regulator
VDDELGNVLMLRQLLEDGGYHEVRVTTDPTEVEAIYAAFNPDLILLDLQMPRLNGFEVMQRLAEMTDDREYVPILVLTADTNHKTKRAALKSGAKDFLTKPFDAAEVLARVAILLDTRSLHLELRRHNDHLETMVSGRTAELTKAIEQLQTAQDDLRLAQEETIHRLSLAAEFRDDETSRHIERMSRYCGILAARAGKDARESDLLRVASKMHDIGKLAIPDAILLKPGKFTPDEFEVMKGHAEIGYQIMEGSESELARLGGMLAWTHHEKVDGSGYPRGLRGEQIPLEGRIAAIADIFDACHRTPRRPWCRRR